MRALNDYLKTKGVNTTSGTPTRIKFEWHKSLDGRGGRGGQAHLSQICDGVNEFYSELMAGLRSVDVLPTEIIRKKQAKTESVSESRAPGSHLAQVDLDGDDKPREIIDDQQEITAPLGSLTSDS